MLLKQYSKFLLIVHRKPDFNILFDTFNQIIVMRNITANLLTNSTSHYSPTGKLYNLLL